MLSIDLSKKIFSNGILEGHTSVVNSVGFNHDDTKIVSGSYDRTIRVWNVATGECILTLEGHTGEVTSVVFNHDGTKIVSGSWDNTIRVWNVDTGECIFNGNQLENTLRNEFNRTLQVPVEHFNYDTKSIIGMSGEGQNTNPEMYIGKKRGEELVCVIKDGSRVHIMEHFCLC